MSADNLLSPRANALADQVTALRRELALAQEARLAAELRAEGLRGALRQSSNMHENGEHDQAEALIDEVLVSETLAAPPSGFAPLRNLVRELLAATNLPPGQRFPAESPNRRLADGLAELLAAYPALDPGAEPAGEVPRG